MMDTTPHANDLWEGIGGHFDSFSQVICEFIDNSISNFEGKKTFNHAINILLENINNGKVKIVIEDTGTGVEDFLPMIKLGDRTHRESPLNEHGFGLKHALATANPENDNWRILTRTKPEFDKGKYRALEAPYTFDMEPFTVDNAQEQWPGIFSR